MNWKKISTDTRRFRYENKYLVNRAELEILRTKVNAVCEPDENVDENGLYQIRSLYFDDYTDSGFMANEIGIEPRYKWRIRMYNNDKQFIRLEKKCKENGMIYKDSTRITKEMCDRILSGDEEIDFSDTDPLFNQFLSDIYNRLLRPKIVIQYDREPYVEYAGDVRITFDMNICFGYDVGDFFNDKIFLEPLLESNMELLEVKFTELLPEHIRMMLEADDLERTTFSKYYLSRVKGDKFYDYN